MATSMSLRIKALATEVGTKIKALSSSLSTKLSVSDAEATYLSKTGKAASASVADKATADGDGNNISSTYTKESTLGTLAKKSSVTANELASEIKLGRLV